MTEFLESRFANQNEKHIAVLQYVADQLRCYSSEMKPNDSVLTAFAEMLDELVSELDWIEPDYELALPVH